MKKIKEVQFGFAFKAPGFIDRGSLGSDRVAKSSPVNIAWSHEVIDNGAWSSDRDLLDMQAASYADWMERERLANIERRNRASMQG